jgi:ferric-dicitrate binding protein FerR (iron transport regulator)
MPAMLAAAAVLFVTLGRQGRTVRPVPVPGEPVALVERIDGSLANVAAGHRLGPGEWIETGAQARIALRLVDGTSVRLDAGSGARFLSARTIELAAGAVYVDTDQGAGGFEVRTPVATAHDIGTQFEVRVLRSGIRLRVRTGSVELRSGPRVVSGRPGTQIVLTEDAVVSESIAVHGSEWKWIADVAPSIEIEGMVLSGFLERISREHGWTLRYLEPGIAREAKRIVLHGSVQGLTAADAVAVATATSGLGHRIERGELVVFRESGEQ